jgi:uncharacterized protein YcbK (DUF882 family)
MINKYFKELEGTGIKDSLIEKLNLAREISEIPYIINSGYRNYLENLRVGGRYDSSHLKGIAVDIRAISSRDKFLIIKGLIGSGCTRIGIGDDFIHVDIDKEKIQSVIWKY